MASEAGRGAQVRIDGEEQKAARGALERRLIDNITSKRELEASGAAADGSTPDGSTLTGTAAADELLGVGGVVPNPPGLGTLATQNAAAVAVTGGVVTGLMRLGLSRGGTGVDWTGVAANSTTTSLVHSDSNQTGTPGVVQPQYNRIIVNSDTVNNGSNQPANALGVTHNVGGTGATGSREAVNILLLKTSSPTAGAGSGGFFVGEQVYSIARSGDGGTAPDLTSGKGHIFGRSAWARGESGATNLYEVCGDELNVSLRTGATAARKTGLQIVKTSDDDVQGSLGIDAAIALSDQSGCTAPWIFGLSIGTEAGGAWPIDATGTLIKASRGQGYRTTPAVATRGVDLQTVKFTNSAFRSMGFSVSPVGAVTGRAATLGAVSIQSDATSGAIAAGLRTAQSAAVSAGGTGYFAGDIVVTSTQGIYQVDTVSSGIVTAVTMLVADQTAAAVPANPVATSPIETNQFITLGSGLTLTITWSSADINLTLKSGGTSGFVSMQDGSGLTSARFLAAATSGDSYITAQRNVGYAKIAVEGPTNADLLLAGKGTGLTRFGTHAALVAETVTGYITIKDAAGTTRKLAVLS